MVKEKSPPIGLETVKNSPIKIDLANEFSGKNLDKVVAILCKRASKNNQSYTFFWESDVSWANCDITIHPGDTVKKITDDFDRQSHRQLEQLNPEAWHEATQRFYFLRESILSAGMDLESLAKKLAIKIYHPKNVAELFSKAFMDNDLDVLVYEVGSILPSNPWDTLNSLCDLIEKVQLESTSSN